MNFLKHLILYFVLFIPAAILSLFCMAFAPLICLFMDDNGYLPKYLKWFEPVDTARGCWDRMWAEEHPDWSFYKVCWTFIKRNPAYGFLAYASCDPILGHRVLGNLDIDDNKGVSGFFFILGDEGQWQFRYIYPIPFTKSCVQGDWGWQLKSVMHKTYCNLQLAPVRFYKFGV